MSDGAFSDRLTQLRNRWEADPTSRIFLQLAEEYRHQGRVKEALGVLDRGLREHPGYLSALVAKGRCHLELGEPEPARVVLERVVKQDATQMVANKLLVRAYLDTGEPDRARERLDLYTLLNKNTPEIEELRRRLRAMEQPPQPPPTSDAPFPDLAPPPAPPRAEAAAPARAAAGGEAADIFDLGLPAARISRPVAVPAADEPFGDLWTPPAPAAPAPAPAPAPRRSSACCGGIRRGARRRGRGRAGGGAGAGGRHLPRPRLAGEPEPVPARPGRRGLVRLRSHGSHGRGRRGARAAAPARSGGRRPRRLGA